MPEAAERKQQGCHVADRRLARPGTDGKSGKAHRREREHERFLAADAVAKVPVKRRTNWPRKERDPEGGERRERGGDRVGRRKEAWKDQHRGRRVDVEVKELDGRIAQAVEEDLRW